MNRTPCGEFLHVVSYCFQPPLAWLLWYLLTPGTIKHLHVIFNPWGSTFMSVECSVLWLIIYVHVIVDIKYIVWSKQFVPPENTPISVSYKGWGALEFPLPPASNSLPPRKLNICMISYSCMTLWQCTTNSPPTPKNPVWNPAYLPSLKNSPVYSICYNAYMSDILVCACDNVY